MQHDQKGSNDAGYKEWLHGGHQHVEKCPDGPAGGADNPDQEPGIGGAGAPGMQQDQHHQQVGDDRQNNNGGSVKNHMGCANSIIEIPVSGLTTKIIIFYR